MRILIDGLSLAGKSTLAQELGQALREAGHRVEHGSGPLLPGIFAPLTRWLETKARPDDPVITWIYCILFFLESVGVRRRLTPGAILIHEGHLAQRLALAEALGHAGPAWALRLLKPRVLAFDLSIYLTASHLERVRRYLRLPAPSPSQRLVLTCPDRLLEADRHLSQLSDGEHDRPFVTDEVGVEALGRDALVAIRRCSEARGLPPLLVPAFAA